MGKPRFAIGALLLFVFICLHAQSKEQPLSVTGKLSRAMAIGGESTGWTIELDSATTIDGKEVSSIEVAYRKSKTLERLANKRVKAVGKLSHRHGVETGDRSVLEISSIVEIKDSGHTEQAPAGGFHPSGSEWLLADLGGSGVLDNVQATLAFPEAGKVAGNGSCNRFFGTVEINGNNIKLSPLGSSRMACPEAVMNQETKYLKTLQAAERFEWKDPYLLIYCKDFEKPLRFTRVSNQSAPASHDR
jgi:heat shock protein HslJ